MGQLPQSGCWRWEGPLVTLDPWPVVSLYQGWSPVPCDPTGRPVPLPECGQQRAASRCLDPSCPLVSSGSGATSDAGAAHTAATPLHQKWDWGLCSSPGLGPPPHAFPSPHPPVSATLGFFRRGTKDCAVCSCAVPAGMHRYAPCPHRGTHGDRGTLHVPGAPNSTLHT